MYKVVMNIDSIKTPGYNGEAMCSFGQDDPQAEWGARGFVLPIGRFPTVVRNRLNTNMIAVFCLEKDIEEYFSNPELIPLEDAVYFEMIWKRN